MIVQTFDIRENCKGAYYRGQIYPESTAESLSDVTLAWKHSSLLNEGACTYIYPLSSGLPLVDYSSNPDQFLESEKIINSHRSAAITAKISMENICFFDLIPRHQLQKWFELREQAMKNILSSHKQSPREDYDILHKAHVLTKRIEDQEINFQGSANRVKYNIFGSKTGRLTTRKGSVPVMTLRKEDRERITPKNDVFVELDFNAAEIRTLMALSGTPQPVNDIHDWISEKVFTRPTTREETKKRVFSWLYNISASDIQLSKIFSRTIFRDFYSFENNILQTPFGRKIKVDEKKAQNYLLQSTTSDIVINNAYKIMKLLEGKKTKIAFTLHDSILLDMSKEDKFMLKELKSKFEETQWGLFASTCKMGLNFGNMRELKI